MGILGIEPPSVILSQDYWTMLPKCRQEQVEAKYFFLILKKIQKLHFYLIHNTKMFMLFKLTLQNFDWFYQMCVYVNYV